MNADVSMLQSAKTDSKAALIPQTEFNLHSVAQFKDPDEISTTLRPQITIIRTSPPFR